MPRLGQHRIPASAACVHQRPQPQPGRDEGGTGALVPGMQRQPAPGPVVPAHFPAGQRRKRHRLRVRPGLRTGRPRQSGHRARRPGCRCPPVPPIRPWSVAMPLVVKRFMVARRARSPRARPGRMSAAVTSFCRSTKGLAATGSHVPQAAQRRARRVRQAGGGKSPSREVPGSGSAQVLGARACADLPACPPRRPRRARTHRGPPPRPRRAAGPGPGLEDAER